MFYIHSIGSGDSVLVGVEDNPEFKSYGKAHDPDDILGGINNPAFSRSIDQVSVPEPFSGGTRTNPLMNMSDPGKDSFIIIFCSCSWKCLIFRLI